MAFVYDAARDSGLAQAVIDGTRYHACSSEPANIGAVAAATLGYKDITLAIVDGAVDGRSANMPAFSDGTVTTAGTASHWAITNIAQTILVASGALETPQALTLGNPLTSAATQVIRSRDATQL